MKNYYLILVAIFITSISLAQTVAITKIVDGTLNSDSCNSTQSGTFAPKVIELYVDGTVDFTGYEYVMEANGGPINYQVTNLTSFGVITDSFIYIVTTGEGVFNELMPGAIKVVNANGQFSGDDYISITDGTNVIDEYGVLGVDGTGEPWEHIDTWVTRINGNGPNPNFTISEWDIAPINALDGATCESLADDVNFGEYDPTLSVLDFARSNFNIYPNPTNSGLVNIITPTNEAINVTVFDVLGKQVITTVLTTKQLNVSGLKAGVYIIQLNQNGATTTKKLVVN